MTGGVPAGRGRGKGEVCPFWVCVVCTDVVYGPYAAGFGD